MQLSLLMESDPTLFPGRSSVDSGFADICEKIRESLESLEYVFDYDEMLLNGVLLFLEMLRDGELSLDFLPYLTFIDAITMKHGQFHGYNATRIHKRHRECQVFFG